MQNRNRRLHFWACKVIVTLPPYILENQILFEPELPESLREAIQQIVPSQVCRVSWVFKDPFWRDDEPWSILFDYDTSDFLNAWWKRDNVLTGWRAGPLSAELNKLPFSEMKKRGLNYLEQLFKVQNLNDNLVSIHNKDWSNDPFSGGAYSFIKVGGSDLAFLLQRPAFDPVYFAGDAYCHPCLWGTVNGVIHSAFERVDQLLERNF